MVSSAIAIRLSASEFRRISELIYSTCGINLTEAKKVLVESRLQKRLISLQMNSFTAYCDMVTSPAGRQTELVHMIDAVTTNKTDFFREPVHFEFLKDEIIPSWASLESNRIFKVWSSACSSGEEPFTTAMVLSEAARQRTFDFRITASDISTRILEKAQLAIYPERTIAVVPMDLRKRYLLRSKDNDTVRIVPTLRSKISWKRLNLMDDVLEIDNDFDLVFCRNVLIYFDRQTQEQVINRICQKMKTGGHLFIGHSESIYNMRLPLRQLYPTIFQKI